MTERGLTPEEARACAEVLRQAIAAAARAC